MARIKIGNVAYKPAVGMHHIQYQGEPTPASIWAGTTWEIDTEYQGRTIIGSGGDYTFGDKGGSANHTNTIEETAPHTHTSIVDASGGWEIVWGAQGGGNSGAYLKAGGAVSRTSSAGGGQPYSIMNPYKVVNYWKRTEENINENF